MKHFAKILVVLLFYSNGLQSQFSILVTNPLCNNSCDGKAKVVPEGNYQYRWNNGTHADSLTHVCPGGYYCIVSDSVGNRLDSVGCNLVSPPALFLNATRVNVPCSYLPTGSATITVSNGTPPYLFNWSNGVQNSTGIDTGLIAGDYIVTVTDANNCVDSTLVTIALPQTPALFYTTILELESCYGLNNDTLRAWVKGDYPPFHFSLFDSTNLTYFFGYPVDSSYVFPLNDTGVFLLIITDSIGCTDTAKEYAVHFGIPCAGIVEVITDNLEINPNPASDAIRIKLNAPVSKAAVVRVNDLTGRLLINEALEVSSQNTYEWFINVKLLPPGLYLLSYIEDGKSYNAKFIKQ